MPPPCRIEFDPSFLLEVHYFYQPQGWSTCAAGPGPGAGAGDVHLFKNLVTLSFPLLYMSWPQFIAKFHIFTFTTNLNLFLALSVNFRISWWFYVSLYQILALDLDDTRNIIGHAKLFFPRYCFYYLFITTVNSSLTRNIFYVARELFFLSLKE